MADFDMASGVWIVLMGLTWMIGMFTKAFSTYYIDYEGITQKCFFVKRHFYWEDFKFIGEHEMSGGFWSTGGKSWALRCSTIALPKNMTEKEFKKKAYWPPSKTITIDFPEKNIEQFYQEFLSYCGGERDIRE